MEYPSGAAEAAWAMARGAAGLEMGKYPMQFALAAFFGPPPQRGRDQAFNNGTASLLNLNGRRLAVTCHHVLQAFRDRLAKEPDCVFHIGDCRLDPLAQLALEVPDLDVAAIALTDEQVGQVLATRGDFKFSFVEPPAWPPAAVQVGDFVAFGGYPGELRQAKSFKDVSFGSFSSGSMPVTVVRENYLICQFDRNYWAVHGKEAEPDLIRGMSGGPVFALRRSAADIITYEFIGHIYEFSEEWELLYVRLAAGIGLA